MITSMRTPFLSISASILAQRAIRNRRFAGSRHVLSHHWYPFGHMDAPNEGSIPGDPFTFSIFAVFLVPAGHPKSIQNRTFGGQGGPRLTFYSRIPAHSQIVNEFSLILTQKWQKNNDFSIGFSKDCAHFFKILKPWKSLFSLRKTAVFKVWGFSKSARSHSKNQSKSHCFFVAFGIKINANT